MQSTLSFSFRASELTEQLKQAFSETLTGYWQIQLVKPDRIGTSRLWYLAVIQGRVICSDSKKLSWKSFLETLKYYASRLQNSQAKQTFKQLEQEFSSREPLLSQIVAEMENIKLLSHDDVKQALRLKVLSDLDTYLFDYEGQAEFIAEPELLVNAPIRGFELSGLLTEAINRQVQWKQLRSYVPSPESFLLLKPEAIASSDLSATQKQHLQNLVQQGKTLNAIAHAMGKDPLEAAKTFSLLIKKGLVEVRQQEAASSHPNVQPEIFIVDDSSVLVQQFCQLVTSWGYRVNYSNDSLIAVDKILASKPMAIFLDINMPGVSGFELIKQIRRQPEIATIPLVLLTAEKTVSNQWRAQWASCKFLAKPRTPAEISGFRTDLRQILEEVAPIANVSLV